MKALLLISSLAVGGAERQVVTDANLLSSRGVKVTIGYSQEGRLENRLSPCVKRVQLNGKSWSSQFFQLRNLCKRERFDIVHAHMTSMPLALLGAAVGRSSKIPTLVTEHGLGLWRAKRHLWAARLTYRLADHVDAACEATRLVKLQREGISPDQISVTYNCYEDSPDPVDGLTLADLRAEYGIPAETQIVGFVGRLAPVKRVDLLIDIAQIVHDRRPDTVFLIVGDGPERVSLERYAKDRALATVVRFAGHQDDIDKSYALMDVIALPSQREALSVTLIEAAAQGVPAVAFDVGGNGEAISDGETGFVVPFGDKQQFAERIIQLLSDDVLRSTLGRQAQKRACSVFSPAARASALLKLYRALVEGCSP